MARKKREKKRKERKRKEIERKTHINIIYTVINKARLSENQSLSDSGNAADSC